MLIKNMKSLLAVVACVFSLNASAGLITDVEDFGSGKLVSNKEIFAWTHNILDYGFVLGSAESASILIEFRDDDSSKKDGPENAHIYIDLLKITASEFKPVTSWFYDFAVTSLVELNVDGKLVVTVKSIVGDFYIDRSTLNVVTKNITAPAEVPEPSAVLLFALGLLGLGVMRKKARA